MDEKDITVPQIISPNNKPEALDIVNLPVVASSSLEAYINYVNSIPILTSEEEHDLAIRWKENGDVEAARYLVLSHLRLVVSIARGYLGYGLPLADIIQEGTIGLMKAVKRFDPARNVRLVTFALYWIKAEINEYVIKNWRIVKTVTTKSQRKLFFNLRSSRENVGNLSEDEAHKIAEDLSVSKDDVVDMNMRLTGNDVALIAEGDDEFAPSDWLVDDTYAPDNQLELKHQNYLQTEVLQNALMKLDERSRDIIESRWLLDDGTTHTLQQLAGKYKVSPERIRQIETKAIEKLKQYMKDFY